MNRLKAKEEPVAPKPKKKGSAVARSVVDVLNGNFLSKEHAIKNLPFLFFLTFILICYIGYGYYAEKTVIDLDRVERRLKELKTENTTIKSTLSYRGKQSQVVEAAGELGLSESLDPPRKIEVEPGELAPKE